jgi:hypothetical protein
MRGSPGTIIRGVFNAKEDKVTASQVQTPSSGENEIGAPPGQSASPATRVESSGAAMELSRLLEQQLAQAIQPVLDEFWQQVTQTVEHTVDQQLEAEAATPSPEPRAAHEPDRGRTDVSRADDMKAQQHASQTSPQQAEKQQSGPGVEEQADGKQAQPAAPEQAVESERPQEEQPGSQGQEDLLRQSLLQQMGTTLHPALQIAEQQSEQWLRAVVIAGLAALLSESTHVVLQQRAEQGLHELLQKTFEALPADASSRDLQAQTELVLQAILRETFDEIYSQQVRTTLEQQGELAVRDSLHRDFEGALRQLEDVPKVMSDALVTALRHQWQHVLRLLLRFALKGLEISLEQSLSSKRAAA